MPEVHNVMHVSDGRGRDGVHAFNPDICLELDMRACIGNFRYHLILFVRQIKAHVIKAIIPTDAGRTKRLFDDANDSSALTPSKVGSNFFVTRF